MIGNRHSGILLHPTSLPGPHGSGDLGVAAFHFVDWLVAGQQTLWQVLPLGGIGPGNSPYMSPSAFAGNELLIDLVQLRDAGWLTTADIEAGPVFRDDRVNQFRDPFDPVSEPQLVRRRGRPESPESGHQGTRRLNPRARLQHPQ